jgi:hypothetical protein
MAGAGFPFNGWHGDPGFVDSHAGDFRLRPDALARGKGCVVTRRADASLACEANTSGADPDVGAYQGDVLIEGPEFIYRGDEQPRVMKVAWRTNENAVQLEIVFSIPIQDPPDNAHAALRVEGGSSVGSEPCRKLQTTAMECRFPGLQAIPPKTATLLLPRSIKSPGGKSITLWAAPTTNLAFQE